MSSETEDHPDLWTPDAADEEQQPGSEPRAGRARGVLSASPLVWILLVVAAAWAVWSTATKGSGKPTATRAVAVPTDGSADRTVAALPCSALTSQSSGGAATQQEGADTVVLPRASGLRIVLVPSCATSGGGESSGGGSSKATGGVIVLPPGTPMPAAGKQVEVSPGGSGASATKAKIAVVFRVPDSSAARTIIVPPCSGKAGGTKEGALQPPTAESGRGILLVPPCSASSGGA
jgi:hypothetical protein